MRVCLVLTVQIRDHDNTRAPGGGKKVQEQPRNGAVGINVQLSQAGSCRAEGDKHWPDLMVSDALGRTAMCYVTARTNIF